MAFGINTKEDRYKLYKNKSVRINTTNRSYMGIFQNHDSEFIYLCPVMVYETLPTEKGENKMYAKLERTIPVSINYSTIESIEQLDEGYLEKLVFSINSIKDTTKKSNDST